MAKRKKTARKTARKATKKTRRTTPKASSKKVKESKAQFPTVSSNTSIARRHG
jgi:hypothetical protein